MNIENHDKPTNLKIKATILIAIDIIESGVDRMPM